MRDECAHRGTLVSSHMRVRSLLPASNFVAHEGLLYIAHPWFISVYAAKGGEPIRTFTLEQPGLQEPTPFGLEIDDFAIVNGRVYSRDYSMGISVCDLDGKLMQHVELAAGTDRHGLGIKSSVGAGRGKMGVRGTIGLLVDARHVLTFEMTYDGDPFTSFLGAPWHDGSSVLVLQRVGIRPEVGQQCT